MKNDIIWHDGNTPLLLTRCRYRIRSGRNWVPLGHEFGMISALHSDIRHPEIDVQIKVKEISSQKWGGISYRLIGISPS